MHTRGCWKNFPVIMAVVMASALSGCAYYADLAQVTPQLPNAAVLDTLPLKAAVFIPASTRNFSQPTDVSRGCLAMHVIGDFGRIFAGTVEGTLQMVFDDLAVVDQPAPGPYDILVEAQMTEYVYKAGCMGNPGSFGTVKGSMRALDGKGREIWRATETSRRSNFTGSWQEFVPESMTSLVGTWVQELTSQPQIRQMQKKTP